LWQTDSIGIRLRMDVAWGMRASNGVAYLTGITAW
jgi:hypothetical protein